MPDQPRRHSEGVVLLHGYGRSSRSLRTIERALQAAQFSTLNLSYQSLRKPIELLADDIDADVAAFAARVDGPVHFVGHSMGGLLTRVYLAQHRPARLGRVVMLGTPNGGSEVADVAQRLALYRTFCGPAGLQLSTQLHPTLRALPAIDYPLGIVAGNRTIDPISSYLILPRPNDGKVSVQRTRLDGMADHIIVETSHTGLIAIPLRSARASPSCARAGSTGSIVSGAVTCFGQRSPPSAGKRSEKP